MVILDTKLIKVELLFSGTCMSRETDIVHIYFHHIYSKTICGVGIEAESFIFDDTDGPAITTFTDNKESPQRVGWPDKKLVYAEKDAHIIISDVVSGDSVFTSTEQDADDVF